MIPEFPQFKKLEFSDKADVEALTCQYPPYSDFNFTSMWCWDIREEMELSQFNKNLVVKFNDYVTQEPFYSFLGVNQTTNTALELIRFSIKNNLKPSLRLVPEISLKNLDKTLLTVKEDRDNFDYILLVERIKKYQGGQFEKKRGDVRRFVKRHQFTIEVLNLQSEEVYRKILEGFDVWAKQKNFPLEEEKNELLALKRFLKVAAKLKFSALGIFSSDKLIAFWITEEVENNYAISHFEKANNTMFKGIYAYLKQQTAFILSDKGVEYVNLEQDLGVSGIRANKESYFPHGYLKKFILTSS